MTKCIKCSVELLSGINWYPSSENNRQYKCKTCMIKLSNDWIKNNRERYNLRQRMRDPKKRKEYYKKNKSRFRKTYNKYTHKLKLEVLNYYSNNDLKCACCGEHNIEFLSIDHINGNGTQHRKEIGVLPGRSFYLWLKKHKFPQGYRVLCFNCNCALGFFGYCPHENRVKQDSN